MLQDKENNYIFTFNKKENYVEDGCLNGMRRKLKMNEISETEYNEFG